MLWVQRHCWHCQTISVLYCQPNVFACIKRDKLIFKKVRNYSINITSSSLADWIERLIERPSSHGLLMYFLYCTFHVQQKVRDVFFQSFSPVIPKTKHWLTSTFKCCLHTSRRLLEENPIPHTLPNPISRLVHCLTHRDKERLKASCTWLHPSTSVMLTEKWEARNKLLGEREVS